MSSKTSISGHVRESEEGTPRTLKALDMLLEAHKKAGLGGLDFEKRHDDEAVAGAQDGLQSRI